MKDKKMHHVMDRNPQHASLIAGVAAAGDKLTPYFVSSQASEHIAHG
jgi:hypothetical protein